MNYEMKLMLQNNGEIFFGPGVAALLRNIEELESVKEAAKKMNLSYSKAWTMLKNAELGLGKELVYRSKGGLNGGGSASLTETGKKLLSSYDAFSSDVFNYLDSSFKRYFND